MQGFASYLCFPFPFEHDPSHPVDQLAQRLQQERLRRGLTISELAQRTKIREPYIHALESGTYNVLPSVYVRSFVKTLGAELGIPGVELNRLVSQCIDGNDAQATTRQRSQAEVHDVPKGAGRAPQTDPLGRLVDDLRSRVKTQGAGRSLAEVFRGRQRVLIIGAVVMIIVLAFWLTRGPSDAERTDIPPEIIDVSGGEQDSLILTAVTTDTAELTITMDGERSSKFIILPGSDYRWSAMKRFTVSNIFNAGAIQFARDGKPLPMYGKPGEVLRELVISRTEVVASNSSKKMITAPADPERARRDSIIEQRRRDSIRAVRRKERSQSRELVKKKKPTAKPERPRQRRARAEEPPILRTPPRSVR
ncbi:MAG: helix-turn-helix domain-containing protein [Candidatus Kapabacteria bacterium]|nr:helix-turn-helix domain-containing protein [Candidatus Kapabacteria bacterium]